MSKLWGAVHLAGGSDYTSLTLHFVSRDRSMQSLEENMLYEKNYILCTARRVHI